MTRTEILLTRDHPNHFCYKNTLFHVPLEKFGRKFCRACKECEKELRELQAEKTLNSVGVQE